VLKGFKDFVLRGNVIDLSVAVVIGAAFATLVKQFGDSFLVPLIALAGGGGGHGGVLDINGTKFAWGAFFGAAITFLITAGALYFLVVAPMNALAARRKRGDEPEPATPAEDILLLQEIRDLLAERNGQAVGGDRPAGRPPRG
jgi:large conductance mechanosensitive channel